MKSILSKLWLAITTLVLIILLIIWLFQVGLLNRFYINERKDTLVDEANHLAALFLENEDDNGVSQEMMEEVHAFNTSMNARILILDKNKGPLFLNSSEKEGPNNSEVDKFQRKYLSFLLNDEEIKSYTKKGKPFVILRENGRFPGASIFVGVPIIRGDEFLGSIIIDGPLAPIEEAISILRKQLSFISILSLGIGTLLALSLAKFFTKPIVNIINASNQIAKGDFTAKVTQKSTDEIGVLAETINDMAGQLGKIEALRKEFIANISHELKTPISLIKAYAELVKEIDDMDDEDKNQYLQVISDESDRLNHMIEDILYLSKMEAGYSNLVEDYFSLQDLLTNVVEKLSYLASERNIGFRVEFLHTDPFVYGDASKMYEVFYNIIHNHILHSYEEDKITIRTFDGDHKTRIETIDHGKGISPDDLPHIWERFYKADKSGKRNDSGTGLGMAIVKNILEAHQFRYGIESELNKGTMVWIEMDHSKNDAL